MTILMKKTNDPKIFMNKGMQKGMFMNKAKALETKSMPMYDSEEDEKKVMKKPVLEK
jgi:hypothetical protein